ncbi:GNAT family N-acetyltransferase [candidate division KSB1 bacterium]
MIFRILSCSYDDIPVLVGFQQKMAMESEGLQLNESLIKKGIKAVIDDSHKGIYYKVLTGNMVIGCMMNTLEWSDWRNGYFIYIQSLYILPEFRKQGAFSAMYNFLKQKLYESGIYIGIRLYVSKSNKVAKEVYKKAGMDDSHYQFFEWVE